MNPVYKGAFFATSGLAVGISTDAWSTIATIAAIVAGWIYMESRIETIVKVKLDAHTSVEDEWRKGLERRLDDLMREVTKD